MQIRYLEAMQAMAKSANSKVIFLPGTSSSLPAQMMQAEDAGEGPSRYGAGGKKGAQVDEEDGFQRAMNARVIENI